LKKQETKTEIKPKEEIEDKKEPDLEKVEEGTVKIEVFKNYILKFNWENYWEFKAALIVIAPVMVWLKIRNLSKIV